MMNITRRFLILAGCVAAFGLSSAVQAVCSFSTEVGDDLTVPDGVSDSSGHGNLACDDFIGANNEPMTELTGLIINTDGSWVFPESEWELDGNLFITNTPDHIVLRPSGKGAQCDFIFLTSNAVAGAGLAIGGGIDPVDSFACTDNIVNSEEINQEPDLISNQDACDIVLKEGGEDRTAEFEVFVGQDLEGTTAAICNPGGQVVNECVIDCPGFIDVRKLQDEQNLCLPGPGGKIPLSDGDQRCTPCLTAAEAEAQIPGYDAGGDKLCWEYSSGLNTPADFYRPHTEVRSWESHTTIFNECTETTTTFNFFGRLVTKTITTCPDDSETSGGT